MLRLSDFASSTITSPVLAGDLSVEVASFAPFPAVGSGDFFYAVLQDYSDKRRQEIVKVVSRSGSVFGIERDAPMAFPSGSFLELRLTSAALFALAADGASYHSHAQDALETDVVFTYADGVVTEVDSVVMGLAKKVTFYYENGRVSSSEEVYAGRKRISTFVYSGDVLLSVTVSEVSA